MQPWRELYESQQGIRNRGVDIASALRQRLHRLAELGRCSNSIANRFTYKGTPDRMRNLFIRPEEGSRAEGEPVSVAGMRRARLRLEAKVDHRGQFVHAFSAHLWGRTRGGFRWTVAIHLDALDTAAPGTVPGQKGGGACGHAMFHCHVGPDLDAKPKVRVPFPAVGPEHALDWLLSTVVPEFEPAPWPGVNALIQGATP